MKGLRPKLSAVNNVRYRRPPRYNLGRLRETNVATAYTQHLEAALPVEEEFVDACWTRTKAAISNTTESVLGYVQRSRRNDWFDGECQEILDKKTAARAAMLRQATRQNVESYRLSRLVFSGTRSATWKSLRERRWRCCIVLSKHARSTES